MQGADRWRRAVCLVFLGFAIATAGEAQATGQTAGPSADLNVETFDFAWRKIADTFWDQSMGGVDWQTVGDELRPRARAAANNAELRLVLQDMLSRLGQSHFGVLPGPGSVESPSAVDDSGDTGRMHAGVDAGRGGRRRLRRVGRGSGIRCSLRRLDARREPGRTRFVRGPSGSSHRPRGRSDREPGPRAARGLPRTGVSRSLGRGNGAVAGRRGPAPWRRGRSGRGGVLGPGGRSVHVRTRTGPPSGRGGDRIRQPAEDAVPVRDRGAGDRRRSGAGGALQRLVDSRDRGLRGRPLR